MVYTVFIFCKCLKPEFSAEVNTNDKILTLSTCKDNFGNRVVMHAKLIKKELR